MESGLSNHDICQSCTPSMIHQSMDSGWVHWWLTAFFW